MMQINTKWHTERMEALGVTDLTDPVQCAAVAVDYLQELESRYGFEPESSGILMAYNAGPSSAKNDLNAGKTSTDYSRKVMTVYQGYLDYIQFEKQTGNKAAPGVESTESGAAAQSATQDTPIITHEGRMSIYGHENGIAGDNPAD